MIVRYVSDRGPGEFRYSVPAQAPHIPPAPLSCLQTTPSESTRVDSQPEKRKDGGGG